MCEKEGRVPLLELRPITPEMAPAIYENAMRRDFPRGELRPLAPMLALYKKGIYSGTAAYLNGNFETPAAYAFFAGETGANCLLLDYFAVEPALRGQGVGSAFLQQLQTHLAGKGLLIEAENPEGAKEKDLQERLARVRFYERAGAVNQNLRWLLFGVEYTILHLPGENCPLFTPEETKAALQTIYKNLVPALLPVKPHFI